MASREELLQSIDPGMRLDKGFFLKIYGYELTRPGFAEMALQKLEQAGCSKARDYYTYIVDKWEFNYDKEMKKVANWYCEQLNREAENKKRKAVNELRKNLEEMTDSDLIRYAESLIDVS